MVADDKAAGVFRATSRAGILTYVTSNRGAHAPAALPAVNYGETKCNLRLPGKSLLRDNESCIGPTAVGGENVVERETYATDLSVADGGEIGKGATARITEAADNRGQSYPGGAGISELEMEIVEQLYGIGPAARLQMITDGSSGRRNEHAMAEQSGVVEPPPRYSAPTGAQIWELIPRLHHLVSGGRSLETLERRSDSINLPRDSRRSGVHNR